MLEIQTKLKLSALLEPLSFKSLTLAKNLQKFFILSDNSQFSFLQKPLHDQILYIKTSIKILTKSLNLSPDKIWVQLLFVDTLLSTCQSSLLTPQLIEFLTNICDELNHYLNKIKTQKPSKNSFFTSKITTGISKFKSMMSISATLSRSSITPTNFSKNQSSPRSFNNNDILINLLDSVLSYQRKKLQLFDFIRTIKSRRELKQPIISDNEQIENLVQNVWKIINLIKFHSTIVKSYKKISHMSSEMNPFILAMFIRLCKDSLLLYPYIAQSIQIGAKNVKLKYDAIVVLKLPKEIKKIKLQKLSRDKVFIEVDNMVQQLTSINETVFYLFCAKTHFQYLNLEVPKNFFLNTTNHKLDDIHLIIKEVHQASQKHQKSKMYISQMVQKLDQSVSKIVQKEKQKQSLSNIMKPQYCKDQSHIQNQEEQNNNRTKKRGRQQNPIIFEEITQEV